MAITYKMDIQYPITITNRSGREVEVLIERLLQMKSRNEVKRIVSNEVYFFKTLIRFDQLINKNANTSNAEITLIRDGISDRMMNAFSAYIDETVSDLNREGFDIEELKNEAIAGNMDSSIVTQKEDKVNTELEELRAEKAELEAEKAKLEEEKAKLEAKTKIEVPEIETETKDNTDDTTDEAIIEPKANIVDKSRSIFKNKNIK